MTAASKMDLKPCPFCGNLPVLRGWVTEGTAYARIRCGQCGVERTLHTTGEDAAIQKVVAGGVAHWWNQRVPATESAKS